MKKRINIPQSHSEMINVLVRVVTAPAVTWDIVAAAADLMALEVRFDNWFLTVAKPSLGAKEVDGLLDVSDRMTDLVKGAWDAYERSPDELGRLRDALTEASRAFRAVASTAHSSSH